MRILVRYAGRDISHRVLTKLFEAHGQVESIKAGGPDNLLSGCRRHKRRHL